MTVPAEVKKILDGGAWASAGGALTQDPSAATPAVTRADGYGAAYSATLVPEQETIQGRWNEFDSAIIDIFEAGIPFYDAMIDYPANAIVNEGGTLSRALVANGPTAGNAIAPSADTGGTTWARVSGTTNVPGRPAQPTATTPEPGTLDVQWNCPLDGGSVITSFVFQYREAGGSWPGTERTVTVPRAVLTGLTNGQAYEFRVMAVNAIGDSVWSPTGTGTPTASAPVGGSALALRADAGDGEVELNWLEPDDGGDTITSYEVQWRSSGQTFNSTRQRTVTSGTMDTVPTLTNGTQYFFRVRAVNGQGESTWSNEASATPAAPPLEGTPSILTENSMLSVDGGDTVALRVKLGGEPSGDVTVALSEMSDLISLSDTSLTFTPDNWDSFQDVTVTGVGNSQSYNVTGASASVQSAGWERLAWPQTQVIAGLRASPADVRYPLNFSVRSTGVLVLQFSETWRASLDAQGEDLSAAFENNGQVQVVHGGTTYTFTGPNASTNSMRDTGEVYDWTEAGTANALALFNAISANDTAVVTFRDFVAGDAPIFLTASGPAEYANVDAAAVVTVG